MSSTYFNPIETVDEFNSVCKSNIDALTRVINFTIEALDSDWRHLSRKETGIRKHQLEFLEDLLQSIQNAAQGTLKPNVQM